MTIDENIKDTHNPLEPKLSQSLGLYVYRKFNLSSFVWIF